MITTSIRDLRALANHFSTMQTTVPATTSTPTTQTPPTQMPLPVPRSNGQQPAPIDEYQQQHHRRSVVADVAYLQGVHHHHQTVGASSSSSSSAAIGSAGAAAASENDHQRPHSNLRDLLVQTIHKKVLGRLLIVGDVHGCPDQLRELVRTVQYDKNLDLLIIAGDLVNKGPDSHGAVRAAMELGALCVLGNHDATVLELCEQIRVGEIDPFSKKSGRDPAVRVARQMTDDCIEYLQRMPHVIKVPQYNLQVLHAGINLSYRLEEQSIRDITHLRRLEWNTDKQKYDSIAKGAHGDLWAKLYRGPETIVFGHDARSGLQDEQFAIGLDTGCCYGGALTAVMFPGRKFVSVPGLPKENRIRTDEDFDETASRLDTPAAPPARDLSPAPSSFYDPVSLSNRSTPYSATVPNGVDVAFPMAPSVQQLFQKHRLATTSSEGLQASSPPMAVPVAVHSPAEVAKKTAPLVYSQAVAADNNTDPISYLRGIVSSGRGVSPVTVARTVTPPLVKPLSPSTAVPIGDNDDEVSSHQQNVAVQLATLKTLVKGQHAKAISALLQTDLYRGAWESMLQDDNESSHLFWTSFVEMIMSHTERERTTLTDDTLELVDLLIEILEEKRSSISQKALARVAAFANRLEAGELKGLSKGVLKAVQILLK